jgi:hypothetical protein
VRSDLATICGELADVYAPGFASGASFEQVEDRLSDAYFELTQAQVALSELDPGRDQAAAVDRLGDGMQAVREASQALSSSVSQREYERLEAVASDVASAVAEAREAAAELNVAECAELDLGLPLFEAAVALGVGEADVFASSGDYFADAEAACQRFLNKTLELRLRAQLESVLPEPDDPDYLQAAEDRILLSEAFQNFGGELARLPAPAGLEREATELAETMLETSDLNGLASAAERFDELAATLGLECASQGG